MTQSPSNEPGNLPNNSETFRAVPNASADFGKIPHHAETFRTIPNASETFGTIPHDKESYTLTVREVARMFEEAGVARTERSIVNWCQPNKLGVSRLLSYFDPNERKYFISKESVDRVIAEEKLRASRPTDTVAEHSEPEVPKAAESPKPKSAREAADSEDVRELQLKLRDLEITSRVKDGIIDQLNNRLEQVDDERKGYIQQLIAKSHDVGVLETQVLQLSDTRNDSGHTPHRLTVRSEQTTSEEGSEIRN